MILGRRKFIALLGGAAAARPFGARASNGRFGVSVSWQYPNDPPPSSPVDMVRLQ
jgi:hypothetical protein